jgi:hypothetical protein
MSNSEIGGLIILLDTVLAPVSVVICFVLLWSISAKLQVVIDILRKMEKTKIKFFDDAHNK